MRLGKWMWGAGLLMLVSGNCLVLPASASEKTQVVTRGRVERPERGYDQKHKKQKHHPPKRYEEKRFRKCPPKSIKVYHRNKCYYYYDGFYYRPCSGGYYERFRPFIGMIVPLLPQLRVHVVHRGGLNYLLCEGVLYSKIYTRKGFYYKVVGFM